MANQYVNSRLPLNLPRLRLYSPSYPLICLAAQYSQRAYAKALAEEREVHVEASWRLGTKAMVVQSLPIDDRDIIIFAIRGTQTFMDWAVNLNSAPDSPIGFLDDPGNLCHSGFLSVARKMVSPVYSRLRSLLEENPSRCSSSLLITGHSAGGAIATLLYAHILAEEVGSELGILANCFKRIHCITFGTPPLSLLPIAKPMTSRHNKSLFLSFINEGDPVPRADKAYIRSLIHLYSSPAPGSAAKCIGNLRPSIPKLALKLSLKPAKEAESRNDQKAPSKPLRPEQPPKIFLKSSALKPAEKGPKATEKQKNSDQPPRAIEKVKKAPNMPTRPPIWKVPSGALSNAGRLVVLRAMNGSEDDVTAEITTDTELRGVVFGDPAMHAMKLYARRVEVLATKAVTASIIRV